MDYDTKMIGGKVIGAKQIDRDGVKVGIVEGYIATWDLDRGDWLYRDQFVRGAFAESISEHQQRKRMPRFKDHHGRTIGGWQYETLREDDTGLFGVAEINLEVQQGREAYSLAKQGVLTDFSVGFTADEFSIDEDKEIRTITRATLWEGSIVDEPMNPHANITAVKGATRFGDLPLADDSRGWDSDAAMGRVRDFTGSEEEPSRTYRNAFMWFDAENAETFGAYKLPFADVVDGELVAVPRAIFAAAAAMQGARGGVDIPDNDRPGVRRHINRYYEKMDRESPFEDTDGKTMLLLDADMLKLLSERDLDGVLRSGVRVTRKAAKSIISCLDVKSLRDAGDTNVARDAENGTISADVEGKLDELLNKLRR